MAELKYHIEDLIVDEQIQIKLLEYEFVDPELLDLSILTESEVNRFSNFGSEKRKLEFYFTRILLSHFDVKPTIEYKSTGKPVINDGHISISHAKNTIIIGYSPTNIIGIDIEYFSEKIIRIKDKFVGEEEKVLFDTNNEIVLTLLWSIKEAVYKMEDIPGLLFKEDIRVKKLNENGVLEVHKNNMLHRYTFLSKIYDNYVVTYCQLDNK